MIDMLVDGYRHVFHLTLPTGFRHDWYRLTSRTNNGVHITTTTLHLRNNNPDTLPGRSRRLDMHERRKR